MRMTWLNRIRFPARQPVEDRVTQLCRSSGSARATSALSRSGCSIPKLEDFKPIVRPSSIRWFSPIIEGELGYRLIVIDGQQAYDHARIDRGDICETAPQQCRARGPDRRAPELLSRAWLCARPLACRRWSWRQRRDPHCRSTSRPFRGCYGKIHLGPLEDQAAMRSASIGRRSANVHPLVSPEPLIS